jgi:hypothetical protein
MFTEHALTSAEMLFVLVEGLCSCGDIRKCVLIIVVAM